MNNLVAQTLANAVTLKPVRLGFETSAFIEMGIELSSSTQTARVVSENGDVLLNWISATRDTVRAADTLVRNRIDAMNDELDAAITQH